MPGTTSRIPRRWLSTAEAADYLGVTTRSVREYISKGVLPARKIRSGKSIRIDIDDLDRLLEPIRTVDGPDAA